MNDIALEGRNVRLLVELGFAAVARGLTDEAVAIFEGVRTARPLEEAGFIGSAMTSLASGKFEEAIALLRKAPPSDAVLAFLGLALSRHGDLEEAASTLEKVVHSVAPSPSKELATEILAELRGRRPNDRSG